jgi:hypothetical protein
MRFNPRFLFWFGLLNILLFMQYGWKGVIVSIWIVGIGNIVTLVVGFILKLYQKLFLQPQSIEVISLKEWLSLPALLGMFVAVYWMAILLQ